MITKDFSVDKALTTIIWREMKMTEHLTLWHINILKYDK
jgi:hypothetical protein